MKTFVILASLLLAGCATTGGISPGALNVITEIEQGVQTACGFAPDTATIQAILSTFGSGGVVAGQVINMICTAVRPAANSKLRMARLPTVRGVRIHGHFIN